MRGRWKKDGKHSPPNNKLVEEPEGNEEIRYPDPDSNKTKINYAKEPNEAHKNTLKEELLQVTNDNFIEMILDMVNQNLQEIFKKFQDNKNKEYEKAQEQRKETIEALYEHERETNLRKKTNRNTKQNGKPLQQTRTSRGQISELKDGMVIKGKSEELFSKQLKTCEWNK
jgi:hypothetical protein